MPRGGRSCFVLPPRPSGACNVSHVGASKAIRALLDLAPPKAAVPKPGERGVQVATLTGDSAGTAARIAGELGIDTLLADVLPGQKAD